MAPAAAPHLVCLVGPTASGKSAAALALGARYPIDIVSLDSAQVYRQMDIGTAKPSRAERDRVPHHLIDILDPREAYSAARFCADARRAIAAIRAASRIPLLVGGTMLYLKALREGLNDVPPADAAVRARLDRRALESGWPALHEELAAVDPVTARRLAPTDSQRIQRALEVFEVSGRPLSAFHDTPRSAPLAIVEVALEPSVRSTLHERIARRLDRMLQAGFVEEVRALRARGDLSPSLPSMRSVGYRQIWEHLEGLSSAEEMRARAIAATRQLAKRQLTWLRARPERHVVDCLADDYIAQTEALVAPFIDSSDNPVAMRQ